MSRKIFKIKKPGTDPEIVERVENLEKGSSDYSQTAYAMRLFVKDNTKISNVDALNMPDLFPTFEELYADGVNVQKGIILSYGKMPEPDSNKPQLWRTLQETLPQEIYPPGEGTESIYEKIDKEHTGNKEDPIPWQVNMQCYEGLYYVEDSELYICTRDSGIPLNYKISELIGQYFEKSS